MVAETEGKPRDAPAPSPQATRVESLFHLVKEGSNLHVRENAAEKLGEIALQSPVYCRAVLQQIRGLLNDKEWDVRVAAAKCLDVVARSFRTDKSLRASVALHFAQASFAGREASCPRLNFRTVEIDTVLRDGAPLLRSGGEEYEYTSNLSEDQRRVQAVRQRQLLLRRICGASAEGIWKTGEDSLTQQMLPRLNTEHVKELAEDIEASELVTDTNTGNTAEETRKRPVEILPEQHRAWKKIKTEPEETRADGGVREPGHIDAVAMLVADLFESVFDSKWEVRHGSFAALRHILLSSGLIDGINHEKQAQRGTASNHVVDQWLEECLIRCMCVLALDQFVDYSADGSVAPVRELTAQVFGILLGSLHDQELLKEYTGVLRKLLSAPFWHSSHGGLLGVKYLLQAHTSHASALVPLVVDDVVDILGAKRSEAEEDVIIVATTILGDITSHLGPIASKTLHTAARSLWSIVNTARSTGSFVSSFAIRTLQLWYEYVPVARVLAGHSSAELTWTNIVRIVPLLHHHKKSVRVATAKCIGALMGNGEGRLRDECAAGVLRFLLSHMLLQLLRDEDDEARVALLSSWAAITDWCVVSGRLVDTIEGQLAKWLQLLWTLDHISELNIVSEVSEDRLHTSSLSLPSEDNIGARVAFAEALGVLMSSVPVSSQVFRTAIALTLQSLNSVSGERQCGSLLLLYWWAVHAKKRTDDNGSSSCLLLRGQIGDSLEALAQRDWIPPSECGGYYYSEQGASLQRVQRMQRRLVEIFESAHVQVDTITATNTSAAMISRRIAEGVAHFPFSKLSEHPQAFEQAHFCRQDLFLVDDIIQQANSSTYARVQGLGSCVYCELLVVPAKKSGFLIKALMESIKNEANPTFRDLTSQTIAHFVVSQVDIQRKCVSKIVSNLCNSAVALAFHETNEEPLSSNDGLKALQSRVQGAEKALQAIALACATLESLPLLADVISRGRNPDDVKWTDKLIQENAHLVSVLLPSLREPSKHIAVKWMNELCELVGEPFDFELTRQAVAIAVARICATLSQNDRSYEGEEVMSVIFQKVFAMHAEEPQQLESCAESRLLAGAIMVLDRLEVEMGSRLTAYVPSMLHFAMKAMHAADRSVRAMASKAFADLVPLLPLRMDLAESSVRHPKLQNVLQENRSSRAFLEGLIQGKAIGTVSVARVLAKSFTLREYQQHGVNWLTFLVQNRMGGVLADDMGLGKTVQLLATIANAVGKQKSRSLSLVVCPPIIIHHWIAEAKRCFPGIFASVLDYSGPSSARKKTLAISQKATGAILLVSTYAAIRSDHEQLKNLLFDFVVLDEAHLIRNPKSSLYEAVCSLRASHRFVLSGTPLQNHVGDLWALFSFLMPGYLGDYSEFRQKFELPISRSRERNATPKQKELAAHAITMLHQRVLPFILRRTKDEVLKELPPKIISNVLLPLTPFQQRLYKAASSNEVEPTNGTPVSGVLHHLQLLKRICVHPALVKDSDVIAEATAAEKKSLSNWKHSGKMVGLHDLLVESCDVGRDDSDHDDIVGGTHRCLIFAHLSDTLDTIQDMLSQALPGVTYLRLDGKTPVAKRQGIVTKFNDDPSIDLLLLTTAVGGLGLTLTGADTVIFVEHSWNPFVDLQAMDRAHRIGQKKTVRVFRLIMEGSLEEHIMDLQVFKEQVANTVVTATEASTSMNTNTKNVLHLLKTSSTAVKAQEAAAQADAAAQKAKRRDEGAVGIPGVAVELLNQIGELWDQSQYDSLAFPSTQ